MGRLCIESFFFIILAICCLSQKHFFRLEVFELIKFMSDYDHEHMIIVGVVVLIVVAIIIIIIEINGYRMTLDENGD